MGVFLWVFITPILKLSGDARATRALGLSHRWEREGHSCLLVASVITEGSLLNIFKKVMLLLSIFPEILVSDLMALPPVLLSAKQLLYKVVQVSVLT